MCIIKRNLTKFSLACKYRCFSLSPLNFRHGCRHGLCLFKVFKLIDKSTYKCVSPGHGLEVSGHLVFTTFNGPLYCVDGWTWLSRVVGIVCVISANSPSLCLSSLPLSIALVGYDALQLWVFMIHILSTPWVTQLDKSFLWYECVWYGTREGRNNASNVDRVL